MSNLSLYTKVETLPDNLKKEVSDYIDILINKSFDNKIKILPGFGSAKGKIKMTKDFDAPIDDFKDYM